MSLGRESAGAVLAVLCLAGCARSPPPGSGDVETTPTSDAGRRSGPADAPAPKMVTSYPGGGALVIDASTCMASMVTREARRGWTRALPACDDIAVGIVAHDSVAYVRTGSGLSAIGPDGAERWRLLVSPERVARSIFPPAITPDSLVVVAASAHALVAFKPDGTEAWKFSVGPGEVIVAPPVQGGGEGVLLLTSAATYGIASDGSLRWRGVPAAPATKGGVDTATSASPPAPSSP
jgi:outer membrane protein assembly factor BamB